MDFPAGESLPKMMSEIHGTFWLCSVPLTEFNLTCTFVSLERGGLLMSSKAFRLLLFYFERRRQLKQSDYWQCESFSVNVFVCLRGLPTLVLQPTLVRVYLADRQAPPTRHYPPVRVRGVQPVSQGTCLCSFMP